MVFDTQSVKTTPVGGERGFDGYKKINGRKRFLLVERPRPVRCRCGAKNTLGLLLLVKLVPANTAETTAAKISLENVNEVFNMITLAWADQRPCPLGASYGQERIWRGATANLVKRLVGLGSRVNKRNFQTRQSRF